MIAIAALGGCCGSGSHLDPFARCNSNPANQRGGRTRLKVTCILCQQKAGLDFGERWARGAIGNLAVGFEYYWAKECYESWLWCDRNDVVSSAIALYTMYLFYVTPPPQKTLSALDCFLLTAETPNGCQRLPILGYVMSREPLDDHDYDAFAVASISMSMRKTRSYVHIVTALAGAALKRLQHVR